MPGFDGTGPNGAGPMTGGARGLCATQIPGTGRNYGRPAGAGRTGSGWSGGRRRMSWDVARRGDRRGGLYYRGYYGTDPVSDMAFLKNRSAFIEQELEQIQKRIDELKRNEEDRN